MSFWNTSTGESAYTNEASFESSSSFEPLPMGSRVLAIIDSASWKQVENGYQQFVSIKWSIIDPEEYRNRKVSQNLWVKDLDPSPSVKNPEAKRTKNLKMLAAIDVNAGGRLGRSQNDPTDDDLTAALTGKMMVITLGLMKPDDGTPFNFVTRVDPKGTPVSIPESPNGPHKPSIQSTGDSIPF